MAIKSFVVGELATSADVNTYLTNSGLVYITETTAAGVATKAIPDIFSSTYESYRMVITNLTTNITGYLTLSMTGAPASNYYYILTGATYANVAQTVALNPGAFWSLGKSTTTSGTSIIVDIFRPNIAANTSYQATSQDTLGVFSGGGYHASAVAYTGLTLGLFTAATFSANIKIYGYRQA